jgi:DMSO/TMAO reductase YedYZ molybdopterin-dependent catalytic subunit
VHRFFAAAATVAILAAPLVLPGVAEANHLGPTVQVEGMVSTPTTYSLAELGALPQSTVTVTTHGRHGSRSQTDQGVDLEALVNLAAPVLPAAKNAVLRVVVTVSGEHDSRTFALGELDPNFGNHPALVAIRSEGRLLPGGPELVVAGDRTEARSVDGVRRITVAVESPLPVSPTAAGGIDVITGRHDQQISAARLAALPARTESVTFIAGTAPQTHTETGPTLAAVLAAAHIPTGPDTWVAAVGSDGYVATVTPAEATYGGRPLLISTIEDGVALPQPRLVTDGDVKGGRYVSGVVDLVVGSGPQPVIGHR